MAEKKNRPPSVSLLVRVKCVRKFVGNGGYLISDLLSRGFLTTPKKRLLRAAITYAWLDDKLKNNNNNNNITGGRSPRCVLQQREKKKKKSNLVLTHTDLLS